MHRRIPLLALVLGLFACSDHQLPTGPSAEPHLDIADAASDYKPGFYWLPPMVKNPAYTGTFDPELSPTVEICELAGDACGPVIASYTTTTGTGGELVRLQLDAEQYLVNWHARDFALSTTTLYRVSVRAGIPDVLLGYADIQPVSNGSGLKNVDTDEYIGLVDGRTLKIKFRIESGIVGRVEVQPLEAEVEPGATQQFIAIVRDLHGNPMSADVTWASSDEAVATVNLTGLATAIADGEATITATSEGVSGSATLTVVGGVIAVAAGNLHSCALDASGKAYCWGVGGSGQLGNGSPMSSSTPVAVSGGLTFAAITAGITHTCGITTTGQAYCWGGGTFGQLGNGSTTNRSTPVAVSVSGGLTFAAINAGGVHTCGVTTTGQAYCWGEGFNGRLGNGSSSDQTVPVAVLGGLTFAAIAGGVNNTCGITTGGQAYCWGLNIFGVLGNALFTDQAVPGAVSGGLTFAAIDVAPTHACGITTGGQAYCWGDRRDGHVGDGVISTGTIRTPVAVSGGHTFTAISAGTGHTCGLTTAGQAYCWGLGNSGQLGNGLTANQLTPVAVSGGLTFGAIIVGTNQTCGVTTAGDAYCWGAGVGGQLGNGLMINQLTPVAVAAFP